MSVRVLGVLRMDFPSDFPLESVEKSQTKYRRNFQNLIGYFGYKQETNFHSIALLK